VRALLVHGARAMLRTAQTKEDPLSRWVTRLAARSHPNVACVAMANKTARMAWAMLRHSTNYQPALAAA
jgi:transposase